MINARIVIVSAIGVVLAAVPLVRSQDVRPYEAKMIVIQPLPIQALGFLPRGAPDGLLQVVPVSAAAMGGPDLSRYRGFQFGETLPAVAKQAGLDVSQAKVIHARPALLQELSAVISRSICHRRALASSSCCCIGISGASTSPKDQEKEERRA